MDGWIDERRVEKEKEVAAKSTPPCVALALPLTLFCRRTWI